MPHFKIAPMTLLGNQLLLIPVDPHFGLETLFDQKSYRDEIQARAADAGLSGTVILFWPKAFEDTEFLAPPELEPALAGVTYEQVLAAVTTTLSWK